MADYRHIDDVERREELCNDLSYRLHEIIEGLKDFKELYDEHRDLLCFRPFEIDVSYYEEILEDINANELRLNKLRFDLMKKENLCGKCGCESS